LAQRSSARCASQPAQHTRRRSAQLGSTALRQKHGTMTGMRLHPPPSSAEIEKSDVI